MAKGKTNYPGGGVDTSDATAAVGDIISGKTAYGSAGTKLTGTLALTGDAVVGDVLSGKKFYKDDPTSQQTGTMVDRGTVNITPGTSNQSIEAGKHSGSGVVYGDADLVAANIKTGVNIFGVTGTHDGLPASMDAEGYIQTSVARIYYRKYGKLYIFGQVGSSDGTTRWADLVASDTNTLNAVCSALSISLDSYYAAPSSQSAIFVRHNGSNWIDGGSTQYKLFAILAG